MLSLQRLVSLLCVSIALGMAGLAAYRATHPIERNSCYMTYMWPQYVDVPLPASSSNPATAHYRLLLYHGSGGAAPVYHQTKLTGRAVLFLPGNAGSYQQVRSLAAISLRLTHQRSAPEFDWFAADFREELSGLTGSVIPGQVAFAFQAIQHLRQQAATRAGPIVLVGHSMGGVVARLLLEQHPELVPHVALVVTLATPQHSLAGVLDAHLRSIHASISTSSRCYNVTRPFPPVLSIAGGLADTLIRQDLVLVDDAPPGRIVQGVSSSIPYVWAAADHNCIMWCNQLALRIILLLGRALPSPKASGGEIATTIQSLFFEEQPLLSSDESSRCMTCTAWNSSISHTWRELPADMSNHCFRVPRANKDEETFILIDDTNAEVSHSLTAFEAENDSSNRCATGALLRVSDSQLWRSPRASIANPTTNDRLVPGAVVTKVSIPPGATEVVLCLQSRATNRGLPANLFALSGSGSVELFRNSVAAINAPMPLPKIWELSARIQHQFDADATGSYQSFALPDLRHFYQAFLVQVVVSKGSSVTSDSRKNVVLRFNVPNHHEEHFVAANSDTPAVLSLILAMPVARRVPSSSLAVPTLEMIRPAGYHVSLSITFDWPTIAMRVLALVGPVVFSTAAAVSVLPFVAMYPDGQLSGLLGSASAFGATLSVTPVLFAVVGFSIQHQEETSFDALQHLGAPVSPLFVFLIAVLGIGLAVLVSAVVRVEAFLFDRLFSIMRRSAIAQPSRFKFPLLISSTVLVFLVNFYYCMGVAFVGSFQLIRLISYYRVPAVCSWHSCSLSREVVACANWPGLVLTF
ncbi:hypothetical protein, variant 1 [Capsaspora owczarzaki ATCC 30864]|uniref:GPI inositol-deacylase n=2 Tax=Capsaspora owczarzaki (strain ATCC 30864) TaxID=595528 RepID=A0A0D2X5L4_CAPO3|nr:hypothetical protein, variant 1 [Capsaspora owczarzaki ATCC 30864]